MIVAAAVLWAATRVAGACADRPQPASGAEQTIALLQLFAPALAEARRDPRALLVWVPIARSARALYPREFDAIERAAGGPFPFTAEYIQQAHARWTTEWLVWERAHDAEYKVKAAAAELAVEASGGNAVARARFDAVEREKLERYQERYEEYIRTAKALQVLSAAPQG